MADARPPIEITEELHALDREQDALQEQMARIQRDRVSAELADRIAAEVGRVRRRCAAAPRLLDRLHRSDVAIEDLQLDGEGVAARGTATTGELVEAPLPGLVDVTIDLVTAQGLPTWTLRAHREPRLSSPESAAIVPEPWPVSPGDEDDPPRRLARRRAEVAALRAEVVAASATVTGARVRPEPLEPDEVHDRFTAIARRLDLEITARSLGREQNAWKQQGDAWLVEARAPLGALTRWAAAVADLPALVGFETLVLVPAGTALAARGRLLSFRA